jgi:hypothetical protein
MTIGGFKVCDGGRAFAWADSEVYVHGDPAGFASKLFVNALGGFIGAVSGTMRFRDDAIAALSRVCSIDAAAEAFPREFDNQAKKENNIYGVCGYSFKLKRIVGFRFTADAAFEAQMCGAASWPEAPGLAALDPLEAADFLDIAVSQFQALTTDHRWTGGTLVVADIRPGEIRTKCFPDFPDRVRGLAPRPITPGWRSMSRKPRKTPSVRPHRA